MKKENFEIKNVNDVELIERFNQGDEEALKLLIQRYRKVAYVYIERYFTLFPNMLEKRELYQLSLISLYRSILGYKKEVECSFSHYFSVVFERDILMLLRHFKANNAKANFHCVSLDMRVAETDGIFLSDLLENRHDYFEPEKCMDKSTMYEVIENELNRYNEKEQKIFHMWMQGYTYKEIAKACVSEEKHVEYVIRKIRFRLRVLLEHWYKL